MIATFAAVAGTAGDAAVVRDAAPAPTAVTLARAPQIDAAALRGNGALAIRQGADLYVADGDASPVVIRRMMSAGPVRAMSWSHDGRWLAYATDGELRIASRSGSPNRRIALRIAAGDTFAWSPNADVLAVNHRVPPSFVSPGATNWRYPQRSAQRITDGGVTSLVTPPARVAPLRVIAYPDAQRWSHDGRTIARYAFGALLPYARWESARDAIFTANATTAMSGGELRAQSRPGGQLALAALFADGAGIAYWRGDLRSGSLAADGQTLVLQSFAGPALPAGVMLEHRSWLAFDRAGRRLVFVAGPFREAWQRKSLVLCSIDPIRCHPLAQPAATVSLDPQWRPDGTLIALVRAPDLGTNGPYGAGFADRWAARRTLWLADPRSGTARALAGFGGGVYWPRWSRDGKRLMVFRDGELRLGAANGGPVARIAWGLARPAQFADFFFGDHGALEDDDALFAWTGA